MSTEKIYRYIEKNIGTVLKNPVGFIKYPFIDPGSVYDGNVWDWDTYWSVYGLLPLTTRIKDTSLKERIIEHAKGNVRNFFDHQLEDGYIPMMIENKLFDQQLSEPYLNTQHKNGYLMNMHKPFLCRQIELISEFTGSYDWALCYAAQIRMYLECYDAHYYHARTGLYYWCDDIMIGMDNDPASFGRPKFSTANIFLNSFMVTELGCAAKILQKAGEDGTALLQKREALIRAIHEECFDQRDQFFYSVDVDVETRNYDWFHQGLGVFWKSLPIRIQVWSGFLPLCEGFATKQEAEAMRLHLHDEAAFGSNYGIPTLAKNEKMFNLEATNNPSNWL
ncbi:MAG: trehalase / alfa-L-rhamnosidase / mannosyl oligosaccharide glucosidase, partial [Lachnospiraceae bacterium]|nr:trehalase / alfa-L-rhamnosidase / mannosyl oligosaccharide glucosidase [Lachnospiraceae bacterium]